MPEPTGANKGLEGAPASSPDANQPDPASTPPVTSPDPGANGAQGTVPPFHEVLKHPEFQPFLQKQIEEQVAARTAETVNQVLTQMGVAKNANGNKEDNNAEDIKKLMENFDIDEKRAKELIAWRDLGIDKKTKAIEQRFDVLDLSMRFGNVFQQNPDAKQFEGKMLEIFNNMNEFERNFVLKSQDGATYLYDQAKKRSGILPPAARFAGTSTPSRSAAPSEKVGDVGTQYAQAIDALKKGDRAGYERIMAQVGRR